jgi:hypothetical protein
MMCRPASRPHRERSWARWLAILIAWHSGGCWLFASLDPGTGKDGAPDGPVDAVPPPGDADNDHRQEDATVGHRDATTHDHGIDSFDDVGPHDGRNEASDGRVSEASPVDVTDVSEAGSVLLVGFRTLPPNAAGDNSAAGTSEVFEYQAVNSGTVQTLGVYIDTGTGADEVMLGLYAGTGEVPPALIASTTIPKPATGWTAGWYSHPVPQTNVQIFKGSSYWIAILAPATGSMGPVFYVDVTNGQTSDVSASATLTSLPTSPAQWETEAPDSPLAAYASGD